jgi:hypothetical protein
MSSSFGPGKQIHTHPRIVSKNHQSRKYTYNGNLAAKLILDLPELDRIWSMLLDDRCQFCCFLVSRNNRLLIHLRLIPILSVVYRSTLCSITRKLEEFRNAWVTRAVSRRLNFAIKLPYVVRAADISSSLTTRDSESQWVWHAQHHHLIQSNFKSSYDLHLA